MLGQNSIRLQDYTRSKLAFRGSISVSEASNMKKARKTRYDFLTYSNYKDSFELKGLFKSLSLVYSVEVLVIKKP